MLSFSSLDMQQRTGDVQRAAAGEPILLTSHGKPRNVMMSVEEYRRLKAKAGEGVPQELAPPRRSVTLRGSADQLGYDVSNYDAAVEQMIGDVRSGRTATAVDAELAAVRRAFGGGKR